MSAARALLAAVALAGFAPPAAAAQSSLEVAEELARDGRTAEARVALSSWWADEHDGASRLDRQRALWLRGRLTVDPAAAELDFRRLVIEYPGGPWSDHALLRLAQAAHASGDGEGAQAHVDRLLRDYPRSELLEEAQRWLAGAGAATRPARRPPPPTAAPTAPARVRAEPPESPPDAARPRPERPPGAPPAAAVRPSGRFAVQLGAFTSEARARTLARRAEGAGLEPRIVLVPGSDLLRVRIGRFDSQGPARELLESVGGLGFTAALVRDADREEGIPP